MKEHFQLEFLSLQFSVVSWRLLSCSEMVKMMKNIVAKIMPLTVATDLVNRFTIAVDNNTRNTQVSPTGISVLPILIFGGTFQPRSPWYFQRSTSMARLLKVKLQITPNAYASPRVMTFPRLAMIVNICSARRG